MARDSTPTELLVWTNNRSCGGWQQSVLGRDSFAIVHAYDFARNKLSKGHSEAPPVQLEALISASKKRYLRLRPVLFHLTGHMFCLLWHGTYWDFYPIFHCLTFLVVTEDGNGNDNHNNEEGSLRCIFLACSAQCIHSNVELTEAMLL
ncbi:hypothetical protein RHMOL_Rhmol05G0066400 [Rhododendron molle]|uniref:Uncharacterized protein n=1 Tax=Rhododendron molle TaxID=49168 RepID=A0ACC0NN51_RHOML|nr:hypothetical protein RHMOL_Rhmol05G0066400 [Rhododendron molle]